MILKDPKGVFNIDPFLGLLSNLLCLIIIFSSMNGITMVVIVMRKLARRLLYPFQKLIIRLKNTAFVADILTESTSGKVYLACRMVTRKGPWLDNNFLSGNIQKFFERDESEKL